MSPAVARLRILGFVVAAAVAAVGCAGGQVVLPSPSPSPSPAAASATLRLARNEVASSLAAAGYQIRDAQVPYRPGESPLVSAASRMVVQAVLPNAEEQGFIVLYEFIDAASAGSAAKEFASYIASGPGSVQFPTDAHYTLRQIGAALAFYVWAPSTATDQDAESRIETALASLGQGYTITR